MIPLEWFHHVIWRKIPPATESLPPGTWRLWASTSMPSREPPDHLYMRFYSSIMNSISVSEPQKTVPWGNARASLLGQSNVTAVQKIPLHLSTMIESLQRDSSKIPYLSNMSTFYCPSQYWAALSQTEVSSQPSWSWHPMWRHHPYTRRRGPGHHWKVPLLSLHVHLLDCRYTSNTGDESIWRHAATILV